MLRRDPSHPSRAFTLIELLVVIAILSLIAAFLFPVFAQAREKARAAGCLSNLKQIGDAWLLYAQDYDEMFPTAAPGSNAAAILTAAYDPHWNRCEDMKDRGIYGGWIGNLLLPYTRNNRIFTCPSNPRLMTVNDGGGACTGIADFPVYTPNRPQDEAAAQQQWGIPYLYVSYGYNYISLWNTSLASVPRPADQIAIYDAIWPWGACAYTLKGACGIWVAADVPAFLTKLGEPLHPQMSIAPWMKNLVPYVAPHNNTVNFLFADGHAKAERWDQMKWGNLDRFIPDSDADWSAPLTTLPKRTDWPGM